MNSSRPPTEEERDQFSRNDLPTTNTVIITPRRLSATQIMSNNSDHSRRLSSSQLPSLSQSFTFSSNRQNQPSRSSISSSIGPIRTTPSVSPPTRPQPYFTSSSSSAHPTPFSPRLSSMGSSLLLSRPSTSANINSTSPTLGSLSSVGGCGARPSTTSAVTRGPRTSSTSTTLLQMPNLPLPNRNRSGSLNRNGSDQEWTPSQGSPLDTLPPLLPQVGRSRSVTLSRTLPPIHSDFERAGSSSSSSRDWRHQFEGPSPPQQFEFLRNTRVDRERRHTDYPSSSSPQMRSPEFYNSPFSSSNLRTFSRSNSGGEVKGFTSRVGEPSSRLDLDRRVMDPYPSPRGTYRALNFNSSEWEAQGIPTNLALTSMNPSVNSRRSLEVSRSSTESSGDGYGTYSHQPNVSPSFSDSVLQLRETHLPSFASSSTALAINSERMVGPKSVRSNSTSMLNQTSGQFSNAHYQNQMGPAYPSGIPLSVPSTSTSSSQGSSASSPSNLRQQLSTSSSPAKVKASKKSKTSTSATDSASKGGVNSTRQRKAPKTHVVSACVNCKAAHLACDSQVS